MNVKEIKKLQEQLKEIILLILIEQDDIEIKKYKEESSKVISKLKNYINDEVNNDGKTILDYMQLCDSQDKIRLNNPALKELERSIRTIGGKTAEELGRKPVGTNETVPDFPPYVLSATYFLSALGAGLGVYWGSKLGMVSESEEQREVVERVGEAFGAVLVESLVSIMINRAYRSDIQAVDEMSLIYASGLGAMFTTIFMDVINTKFSLISLLFGHFNAIVAPIGTRLLRRFLNTPSTTVEQASVESEEVIHIV